MTPTEPPTAGAPIEIVGKRFAVRALVAAGAMGEVFLAEDLAAGGRVALKRMQATRDSARFSDECEVLRRLDHPSIVRYVAHGVGPDGRPWLAMEWLDGVDLAARLERAEPMRNETIEWLRGIASGLGAAHAIGIVHRDVKPENVVLVPDPAAPTLRIKIVDFGLARADVRRAATRTGVILGTPAYMAPEQVNGARDVDARADVFALGCIAYECLAGRPAFVAESLLATFAKILFEDPPPLQQVSPATPRVLSDLVARMMAKDRGARPRDGAAVAAELAAMADAIAASPDADLEARAQARSAGPSALDRTLPDDVGGSDADHAPAHAVARIEPRATVALRALVAGRERVQVVAMDENHCIGQAWNVALLVWGRETTRAGVASAERAILALSDRYPEGIGLMTVVEEIANLPTNEVRTAISDMLNKMGARTKRSAVAHEGTGFRAAAVRGVVTGLLVFNRLPYPHRVFDGMEAALAWIVAGLPKRPDDPVDAAAMIAAAGELRRQFDAHRSRRRAI